jgi:hypothetical protein
LRGREGNVSQEIAKEERSQRSDGTTRASFSCGSARVGDLAAVLPHLELEAEDLVAIVGEAQRVSARLADAEERLAFVGPVSGHRA